MYNPPAHRQTDPSELHALIREAAFATLITVDADEPVISHVPMQLIIADESIMLRGHIARANPQWTRHGTAPVPAVAIFAGSDAYLSPRWYPRKAEDGRVVPTWNYRVVHARGILQFYDDATRLHQLVSSLSDSHEAEFDKPWSVGDAPDDYIAAQLRGIVGFELAVDSLEGKWKLSQNRTSGERTGAIDGLRARGDARSAAVAGEMERTLL